MLPPRSSIACQSRCGIAVVCSGESLNRTQYPAVGDKVRASGLFDLLARHLVPPGSGRAITPLAAVIPTLGRAGGRAIAFLSRLLPGDLTRPERDE